MTYRNRPLLFRSRDDRPVDIVAAPAELVVDTGLFISVNGLKDRARSDRKFMLQARDLASDSIVSLSCDCQVMGSSDEKNRCTEAVATDVREAAVDALFAAVPARLSAASWSFRVAASAALTLHLPHAAVTPLVLRKLRLHTDKAGTRVV